MAWTSEQIPDISNIGDWLVVWNMTWLWLSIHNGITK